MRLTGETDRAWAAFVCYRDTPPEERSVMACAARSYGSAEVARARRSLWYRWFQRYHWRERALAYDRYQDRLYQQARQEAIREMEEHWAAQARLFQAVALERIVGMDVSELTPQDVVNYIMAGARLERLSLGLPTGQRRYSRLR